MTIPYILITGGAGFIGSHLAGALASCGTARVVVCDWLGGAAKWRNLRNHDIAEIVAPETLFEWLAGHQSEVGAVLHMGAISATTETDVDAILRTNVTLSQMLWEWCANARVPFLYASSASVYGNGVEGFDDAGDMAVLNRFRPLNPYGWSKLLFDRFALRTAKAGGPTPPFWAGLRFFNVFGPNEYHKGAQKSVIHSFAMQAMEGGAPKLFKSYHHSYADGGQLRDFVYVKDCTKVALWLLEHRPASGFFNIGTGKARSFFECAEAVFAALGKRPGVEYVEMPEALRAHYQYFTEAPLTRLRVAGYTEGFTTLESAVKDYVKGYLLTEEEYF